eukprot:CAMPEP_0205806174 /NCGR_PEP_ID=MMETSP0205-20121125/9615_1 /ASSEMBLY_ACC=CAM_ASM_000278 /TAXON_ID=36767 /ORGANISM="Euplotes focardii, Strain TN1" /LENGTH=123 /DNA_ID=CAMNT_0053078563 /DNA_START=191 /DNA_END=559 /DNA_ORIENTATION=-
MPQNLENEELLTINESYLKELQENKRPENLNTKDSTDNSGEIEKKCNLFISRTEDEDEEKVRYTNQKDEYDEITDLESKMCMTSRETYFDEIEELYLSEPSWHKSSSWMKLVPHRVYKIKTIW